MSDLLFNCPKCSKHLAIDQKGSGSSIKCPDCNATVNVPHAKAFFKCQACHCDLSAPQGLEGNVFKCPECDVDIVVPKTPKTSGVSEGKVCSKCGNEEPDSSLFCKECGTPLSPKISTQNNKCQNCGNNNESDATFCGECGIALTPSSIPQRGKTCPKCRAIVPTPNALICMSCGHNLRKVDISQPPLPVHNELKLKPIVQEGIRLKPNAHKLVYGEQHEIASASCPYCGNPLPADAVICVHCGIDLRTGKKLRMMTPKAKSNFDFNIAPFLQLIVFCGIIWGCYAGYHAYTGSTQKAGSPNPAPSPSTPATVQSAPPSQTEIFRVNVTVACFTLNGAQYPNHSITYELFVNGEKVRSMDRTSTYAEFQNVPVRGGDILSGRALWRNGYGAVGQVDESYQDTATVGDTGRQKLYYLKTYSSDAISSPSLRANWH